MARIEPSEGASGIFGSPVAQSLLERADACGIDLERDVRIIEIAVAEPAEFRADIVGPIAVKDVACLLDSGADGGGDHSFKLFPLPGAGVRVATPGAVDDGSGAPADLTRRFYDARARSTSLVVADIGPANGTIGLLATWKADVFEAQLALPHASQADEARAWFTRAVSLAQQAGTPSLEGIDFSTNGPALLIRVGLADIDTALGTALALRRNVLEAFKMPSGSMMPNLLVGDHIFVLKGELGRKVTRGDVVVFRAPPDARHSFIKRVIAIGGDRIQMRGRALHVNGVPVPATLEDSSYPLENSSPEVGPSRAEVWRETLDGRSYRTLRDPNGPFGADTIDVKVPVGSVYVLGDNRDNSHDSRHFDPVPMTSIEGRVAVVWASFDEKGVVRWNRIGQPVN